MRQLFQKLWSTVFFLLFLILVRPAAAQPICANAAGWDVITYNNFAGTSTSTATCFNDGFKCEKAKSTGPVIELVNPSCDPKAGPCSIRLRVPLEFPGNKQNITIAGGSFGAPTPKVYWFQGGTPPSSCAPRFDPNCGQISICGITGAQYTSDFGETALTVGGVSCSNLTDPKLTTLSISVFSCESRFSCPKRLDISGLDLTPPMVAQALGCPVPPKGGCPDDSGGEVCCLGPGGGPPPGVAGGGGGGMGGGGSSPAGGGGGASPPGSGPGAFLHYLAGGVGHPSFPGSTAWNTTLGRYWSHDYAERIVQDPNESHVWLITRFGTFREFSGKQGDGLYATASPSDEKRKLYWLGSGAGWELRHLDGTVQRFDATGLWTSTTDRNGNAKVATYDGSGRLATVTFPDGRSEAFAYPTGKLGSITETGVGGAVRVWQYQWTGNDLTRIVRPDGTEWRLTYGDAAHPGYMTRMELAGTDGSTRIEAAWEYDATGNVLRTWKGDSSFTGTNAAETWSFSYDNPALPAMVLVTDPMGKVATYSFSRDTGSRKAKLLSVAGSCPSCSAGPNSVFTYTDAANPLRPTQRTDGNGTRTLYTYDANGMRTSMTEDAGGSLQRATLWSYSSAFPAFPMVIEIPSSSGAGSRRATMVYDGAGNQTSRTVEGVESGSAFSLTTTTTYNSAGQPLVIDPPGYGTQDQIVLTYDASRGNLLPSSVTDLAGTSTYTYDAFNRLAGAVDENGVSTDAQYDGLGRLTSLVRRGVTPAGDLVSTQSYNVFGDLFRTTLPAGNVIETGYDAAGRLISLERKPDALTPGERDLYTLDAFGHRRREDLQRWSGAGWTTDATTQLFYSTRCHLDRVQHPDGTSTEYAYDCDGNLERAWDANHPSLGQTAPPTLTYAYDALDRVTALTQPWSGAGGGTAVTGYTYDVQDHLVRVADPNGTATQWVFSDRDLMTRETSETTGVTSYAYNEHAQLVSSTDARNVTVGRTYDAIDRITFIDYPDNQLDTTYTYDNPSVPFSRRRLIAITRNGQSITYAYDRFGRLLQDGALFYTYDRNDNHLTLAYPGGVTATYSYDFADRPTALSLVDGGGPVQPIITSASYKAFGPLASLGLGNGLTESRAFDQRYFPAGITVPGRLDWSYATDAMGNVTGITDGLSAANNRTFAYQDVAYFLTQGNGPWGTRSWTWDKTGNRLSETRDGASESYSYPANAAGGNLPRLAQVAGGSTPVQYFYDTAGDLTFRARGEDKLRLSYGADERLSQFRSDALSGALTQVSYDGRGFLAQSSFRPFAGSAVERETSAVYNSNGQVLLRTQIRHRGPSSPRNQPEIRSDAYLLTFGGRLTGIYQKRTETPAIGSPTSTSSLLYLTTDHLGAPVLATDASGTAVWQGGFEPFGRDWNGAQAAGIFLRLPGQWEDETWENPSLASDLDYNVMRWYASGTGRYSRPDPLGVLRAGGTAHLYGYAEASPLVYADPWGLDALTQNPDNLDCFYCLYTLSNYGLADYEEAAWLYRDSVIINGQPPQEHCGIWPALHAPKEQHWPKGKPLPGQLFAQVHTHPTRAMGSLSRGGPQPSRGDQNTARAYQIPVYTLSPDGIYKFDPSTGKITQEEPANWMDGPKKKCGPNDPCKPFMPRL
ncbi:MAG: RHS repeat domain-containing protein [Thermoanaerobaculia bacterium]